jgi:ribonuclease G
VPANPNKDSDTPFRVLTTTKSNSNKKDKQMTSEVIIDVQPKDISIALLEDKQLVEYQKEQRTASFSVGNIYVAKVKKLMPGLNACFVDVGAERVAFLHYLDLGTQFYSYEKYLKQVVSDRKKLYPIQKASIQPTLKKDGSIANTLKVGQELLVQIVKEPINTKGPRLTCELSFAGRYLVLIPFEDSVLVSTKIKRGEERSRLKQLIQSIKPKNFGVIVRTVAEGKRAAELDAELKILLKRWEDTITKVQKTTERPQLCFEEESRAVALLRDLFNPTYDGIHVNDSTIFEEIKNYLGLIAPEKKDIVKMYNGTVPIFDNFDVTKQVKSGFGKTVNYKHGAYLIIESTEAMHVVDVNSGIRIKKENSQETNALETNLGAADELARQLRLRDMGGIIIVDFIDMKLPEDRQLLYERMCKNMQKDRAKHNILPLSKFGLMQITRQRVRPAMSVNVEETCPTCFGKGTIKSSILFTDTLESKIDTLVNKIGIRKFALHVHPYVAAYINQGLFSLKRQWQMKYGLGIRVIPSQKLAFLQYEFYDSDRQFIDMQEEIETK